MRRTALTVLILLATLPLTAERFISDADGNPPKADLPFQKGENLTYVVKYKWGAINSEVGEVRIETTDRKDSSGDYFFVTANGFTYKFYDIFFKVRDYYESRFTRDLQPVYFHRDIKEGKYTMKNYITFDTAGKIRAVWQRMAAPVRDTLLQGSPEVFDLLSMIFNLRSQDFSSAHQGLKWERGVVIDGRIIRISIIYSGKTVKNVPGLGRFNTHLLSVVINTSGSFTFKGGEQMLIWVSDDKNSLPLQIESPIKVGSVIARLTSAAGLKYPLTSKLQ
ncbi:MAG: DUF3108 domain-containing protein [Bacteroidales bacterium]|nr:DUF3108 domain-containing protein [Bacteroidales bacterium]